MPLTWVELGEITASGMLHISHFSCLIFSWWICLKFIKEAGTQTVIGNTSKNTSRVMKKEVVELLTEEWLTLPFSILQPCFPILSFTIQTRGKPSQVAASPEQQWRTPRGTRGSWQYCLAYCWQDGFLHVLEWINFPPSYRRRNILFSSVKQFLGRLQVTAQWCSTEENCHTGQIIL